MCFGHQALKYLLSRPSPTAPGSASFAQSPASNDYMTEDELRSPSNVLASPGSQRNGRPARNGDNWNTTPRGGRSRSQLSINRSVGKRSGTPAMEYLRWNAPESPYSPTRSFVDVGPDQEQDSEELDFELHGEEEDEGFEGLENVRACCDGRHTVGHSGRSHHHHHHHNHGTVNSLSASQRSYAGTLRRQSSEQRDHLEALDQARPASPAWSFRSKTGSTASHEGGGGGLFSWGRKGNQMGSKRSVKSSLQPPEA